jgi:hypothetical protein
MEALGLTKSRFLQFFGLTVGVHLASYTSFGIILSVSFFCLGLLLLFYDEIKGISFFILSMLLFDDINKYDVDIPPLNSVFTIDFFGQSITMIWSIIMLLALMFSVTTVKRNAKVAFPIYILLFFLFIGLSRFYQFKNPRFTSDVAFIINILIGYAAGAVLLKSEERIKYFFGMVICIFLSKYIIITMHAIISSLTGVLYSFKGESAANYIIVPLILMTLIIFNYRLYFSKLEKWYAFLSLLFIISYLLITISRERILFVTFALIAYLVIYRKIQVVFYISFFLFLAIAILITYNPYMYDFVSWKLTSMLPTTDGTVNASSSVRLIELINIWREQVTSFYKLFIGTGWGGYFRDDYLPFPPEILGPTSFPADWIERNTFFRPHGTYLYVLLKYGLLGTILFYGSFVLFCGHKLFDKAIYQLPFNDRRSWGLRYIQIALCISLPISCLVIFTSKLQILCGFFLATIFYIHQIIRQKEKEIRDTNHKE